MTKKKVCGIVLLFLICLLIDVFVLKSSKHDIRLELVLALLFNSVIIAFVINYEEIISLVRCIWNERGVFWNLSSNDFQARFAGAYLGVIWAFVQPVITMILYWFVFQVGLRASNVSEYPFILYLMSGMIPWFYFSEALSGASNSLLEYNYLVKKVLFDVRMLPVIKIVASVFVHIFFVVFLIIMCTIYGFKPDYHLLQLIYYIACMAFLTLGISYITSACTAFFRDMFQIVNIALTVGIWITPIMWNPESVLSKGWIMLFQLNPMYYIIDGFRDSLLRKEFFWEKPVWTMYYWMVSLVIFLIGIKMFDKLKPHFSDVL